MTTYLRKYRERKYFMRIILSINLLIVSFMLVSLLSAYWYSEKISLDMQKEANEKVLSQINYNISYMNETVKNVAISLFYDNDMAHLLYSSQMDRFEDLTRINKLNKTFAYNSFIHSIVLYNSKRNTFFTGGDDAISDGTSNLMSILNGFLEGAKPIYKMQLMPVEYIPDAKHPERTQIVFSLFMYDSLAAYSKAESALVVNIKPEWLFQKLELMNRRSANPANRIFILDQNQEMYSSDEGTGPDVAGLKSDIYRHMAASPGQVAQFTATVGGEKQIVNYMVNGSINWVVVDMEPYAGVVAAVDKLKVVFGTVAAVSLALALLASLFVSSKLYSPINVLLKETKRLPDVDAEPFEEKDELRYISYSYNHLVERLMKEQSRHEDNEAIIRSYYLRKLLTDSAGFTDEERRECAERRYLSVDLDQKCVIGVLKVDGYSAFKDQSRGMDLRLLHFSIANIVQEIVSEELRSDVADIRGEHLVLIYEAPDSQDDIHSRIGALIRRAQKVVNDYYHVTFTVALSDVVPHYKEMTSYCERALDYLAYRMNFGLNTVITPQLVRRHWKQRDTQISPELERKFVEAIKANRQEEAYRELDGIRREIAGMSPDAVIQAVIHLGILIKQTVRDMNRNKLAPLSIDLRSVDRLVFEKETLDDIFAEFGAILGAIFMDQKRVDESKDRVIVDTIKDVVRANYTNPNLSLQEIADMLKMSSAYVGRMFKKSETVSVADYINEIRLLQSVVLLEKENLPVNEVSEKVGFSSPSYFFKLFKKRFGTTPKDYRIKKAMNP
ncbi:AraC family transcriptional regulator [Paenibacillus flagellatus]|uniref:HTH araC/xylS-type domain-containing protein n=1 Tax=Paenibacillus flagellatus TaxID=2211139 RepID=A0A2V5K2C7_9BACL|nr:AraC family transcriptional regulator [Paenibacillus flagellatus]PYI51934.1 hypothetical protein DLM86_23795 [Paenibacillus flagellatus]